MFPPLLTLSFIHKSKRRHGNGNAILAGFFPPIWLWPFAIQQLPPITQAVLTHAMTPKTMASSLTISQYPVPMAHRLHPISGIATTTTKEVASPERKKMANSPAAGQQNEEEQQKRHEISSPATTFPACCCHHCCCCSSNGCCSADTSTNKRRHSPRLKKHQNHRLKQFPIGPTLALPEEAEGEPSTTLTSEQQQQRRLVESVEEAAQPHQNQKQQHLSLSASPFSPRRKHQRRRRSTANHLLLLQNNNNSPPHHHHHHRHNHSGSPTNCSSTNSSLASLYSSPSPTTSFYSSSSDSSRSYRRRPEKAYCRLLKENTTFHGIRDSIQTAGWLRALWVCIIILASMAALIGCGLIVWEFNTRPLSVTYSIKENGSLVLPDIVICPFNRFNRSYLQSWNVSDELAQYLELAFPQSSQHPFQYKSYKVLLDRMEELEEELAELLERVGLTFAEFIKQSAINCRAFFVNKSLCDTAHEIMTMAGKCFRILGEEQRNDGHGHAQRIIVRLPTRLYNPAPNQMMNDGILVKLAERGKGIDHDMSFVPAGVHAIFPLTATRFEFKHYPPHFLCREKEDPTYSRVWCFEECFLDKAEKECNCSLAAAAQPGTPNVCTPRQFFNCVYGVLRFDDANVVDEQVAQCKARCLPPCKNWRFEKTVTYANFPSEVARHFVKDEAKWEELRNTIILEVFYTTLDYTVIQQMLTITPSSFVAQLGGQISLWIGGSIISVMQLAIYLFSYFCVYFRRTNRRQQGGRSGSGQLAASPFDEDRRRSEKRRRKKQKRRERRKRKKIEEEEKRLRRIEKRRRREFEDFPEEEAAETLNEQMATIACVTARV